MCGLYNVWSHYQMQVNRERDQESVKALLSQNSLGVTQHRATQEKHQVSHRLREGVGLGLRAFIVVSVGAERARLGKRVQD